MPEGTEVGKVYCTKITDVGSAMIAACILNGTKLNITHAAAGDGGGAYYIPDRAQTALVNECWRGEIAAAEISSTEPNMIDIKVVIPSVERGFTVREMGVFSSDGTLIAVCNTPDMEKAPESSGAGGELTLLMHILVADASVVEVTIAPTLDTVSREEMAKALAGKQDKLSGKEGQVVGFNKDGNPIAQEAPEGSGVGQSMAGQSVKPTYDGDAVTASTGAEIFNDYRVREYYSYLPQEPDGNVAAGEYSHAEGSGTTANGDYSHSEGQYSIASGTGAHAEGWSTATGYLAHAESGGRATGDYAHAEGNGYANGAHSHAGGLSSQALGYFSFASGNGAIAKGSTSFAFGEYAVSSENGQIVMGRFPVESSKQTDRFILGKGYTEGSGNITDIARYANCFRVTDTGVFASGNYSSSGADYAELLEWADGNPGQEDRCGRFVALDGEKIRLARPGDAYILGIVSGNPLVVGDVFDDQWQGMYLYDVFGRPVWEDVMLPEETMEMPDPKDPSKTITRVIREAHMEHRQKLNPDYDPAQKYIPRSERPEWDAVGLLGKLVAVDDGSCQVNGYCAVGEGGIATASKERTPYRVMARLDETHVRILILQCGGVVGC